MLQKAMRKLLPVLFASLFLISFGFLSVSAEDLNPDDSFDDQQSSAVDYPEPTDARWPFTPTDPEPTDPPFTEEETVADDDDDNDDDDFYTVPPETQSAGVADIDNDTDDNDDTYSADPGSGSDRGELQVDDEWVSRGNSADAGQSINSTKMNKSVSKKTYSTDYTAGIVSWICVGVGVIVIIVMLVSTKISGSRAARRRV